MSDRLPALMMESTMNGEKGKRDDPYIGRNGKIPTISDRNFPGIRSSILQNDKKQQSQQETFIFSTHQHFASDTSCMNLFSFFLSMDPSHLNSTPLLRKGPETG
jgi:hypothetical protein